MNRNLKVLLMTMGFVFTVSACVPISPSSVIVNFKGAVINPQHPLVQFSEAPDKDLTNE